MALEEYEKPNDDLEICEVSEEEFKEWLSKELPPLISLEDVGKTGKIKRIGWANTKYGRKIKIDVEFEDGIKTALLGKTYVRDLLSDFETTNIADLLGQSVSVVAVKVSSPKGIVKKAILEAANGENKGEQ